MGLLFLTSLFLVLSICQILPPVFSLNTSSATLKPCYDPNASLSIVSIVSVYPEDLPLTQIATQKAF